MRVALKYLLLGVFALVLLMMFWGFAKAQSFKQQVVDAHTSTTVNTDVLVNRLHSRYAAWKQSNAVLQRRPELRSVRGLDIDRILAYDVLGTKTPKLDLRWDDRGVLIYVTGNPLLPSRSLATGGPRVHDITVRTFLRDYGALLGSTDAAESFALRNAESDELGRSHLRYAQLRNGTPIWGKDLVFGIRSNGDLDVITGRAVPSSLPVKGSFRLTADDAARSAVSHLSAFTEVRALDPFTRSLLDYDGPETEAVYFDGGDCLRPMYVVEVRPNLRDRWRLFVSAEDGTVTQFYNATTYDGPAKANATDLYGQTRTIDTYQYQGTYFMIDASRPMFNAGASNFPNGPAGAILTLDAHETSMTTLTHFLSPTNTWADAGSVSLHFNAGLSYEYYRATHGRSAIDNKGSTIVCVANLGDNGQPEENAFWNGKLMAYGNGGENFGPFAKALDVVAHEMTHGVTEHSAGLEYITQSGALNEAFSDIFGAMVDRDDWRMAEDITLPTSPHFPSGAMRDLQDPHNGGTSNDFYWQPKHMNEYQYLPVTQDNGGVHTNSGIPNHAAYLIAQQIGREKTEQIMYRALTTKLTKQSQFIDFRLAIMRCAEELYGDAEKQACGAACDQVGILDGNPTGNPSEIPPVNGIDRMLLINTDPTLTSTLWIAVPPAASNDDFTAVSQTAVWGRPSINDGGTEAMFIDTDFNIRSISLVGAPNEQVLDNSAMWHSVALSRDGLRIAVTTTDRLPQLFVLDLSTQNPSVKMFPVYTPNSSRTEIPNAARFVDAMQFSVSDQVLLFDTYNEVTIDGNKVGFWDINVMDVWSKAQNDFGTGHIERILPQNPEINTGNPAFSNTRPYVIAFDAQFPASGEAYVMTMDANADGANAVMQLESGQLGYPSYSGDDRILSFAYTVDGETSIFNMPIGPDGVTPAGEPEIFVYGATVPLWFRTGSRPVSTERVETAPAGIALSQNYPNPFGAAAPSGSASTTISFSLDRSQSATVLVTDALGREVARLLDAEYREAGEHQLRFNSASLPAGVYHCRLQAGGIVRTRSMLLVR